MTFSAHKQITIYSNQRPFEIIFRIFSGCKVVMRIRINNVRWCNKLCMRYFTYIRTWNNVTMSGTKILLFLCCWCPVTHCVVGYQLISWQGSSGIYLHLILLLHILLLGNKVYGLIWDTFRSFVVLRKYVTTCYGHYIKCNFNVEWRHDFMRFQSSDVCFTSNTVTQIFAYKENIQNYFNIFLTGIV